MSDLFTDYGTTENSDSSFFLIFVKCLLCMYAYFCNMHLFFFQEYDTYFEPIVHALQR